MLARLADRTYVVNLETRADRRREVSAQLARLGLSLTSETIQLFNAVRPDDAGDFPSIGARGCFMSHLGILRDAQSLGAESITIIEDDLDFVPDFVRRADAAIEQIKRDEIAMFYGGYERFSPASELTAQNEVRSLLPKDTLQTSHFIRFDKKAIDLAAAYLAAMLERPAGSPDGGPMHVDGAYNWFRAAHPELKCAMAVPELGHQRASSSDISEAKWFDQNPLIKPFAQLAANCSSARQTARAASQFPSAHPPQKGRPQ